MRATRRVKGAGGPGKAQGTLVGWGSTGSGIQEAAAKPTSDGIVTNQLHFKWIHPFHTAEATAILKGCERTIAIENNFSGQFARHLRAETGFSVDHLLTRYDGEPFVRVLAAGATPATRHVRGSNLCLIAVFADRLERRAILLSATDNLVKGASGQAVQNMNLMVGFDETLGLDQVPTFP